MRAYRIAYDGRPFYGFQRQPDVPTVEDALLDALVDLDLLEPGGEGSRSRPVPEGYAAAGRTDAGVSALAQTVAFEAPDWLTPAAVNAELPASVRAWASAPVPEGFHATHGAAERRYCYHLHAPGAAVERVSDAVERLSGEHDYRNLTPDEDGTVRALETSLSVDGDVLAIEVVAAGFPRHLVRRLASLVRLVATGDRSLSFVDRALEGGPLEGAEGIPIAPPEPLVLLDVSYPGVEFTVDEEAAASAREVFATRRQRAATRARVADRIVEGVDPE